MKKFQVLIAVICFFGLATHAFTYDACDVNNNMNLPCSDGSITYTDVAFGTFNGLIYGVFFDRNSIMNSSYQGNNFNFGSYVMLWEFTCTDSSYTNCANKYAVSAFGVYNPQSTYDFGLDIPDIANVPHTENVLFDSGAEWKYAETEQAGWTGINFDDSQWNIGITPFDDHSVTGWCSFGGNGTSWPIHTSLYLRKSLNVEQQGDLKLKIAIDNDFILYFDGNEIATVSSEGCAYKWQYEYNIPSVSVGYHTIAVKITDRGDDSGFDMMASQLQPLNQATLTVIIDPQNAGTITSSPAGLTCVGNTCQGTFPRRTLVTLTASSDNGWEFNSWNDGNFNNPQNPLAIVMDDNKSIQALFAWNDKITLKAVDSTPLGNRIPLILVHGNNMETVNQFGWNNYINKFKNKKETAFQGMYKLYLFSSDSEQSNHYNGIALGQMIDSMPELANKSLTILAHSRGGLIARYFMNQYAMKSGNYAGQLGGEKVKWLVTLATPHRGSPGADPIWVEVSFDYNFPYPINTNLYTIYFDGSGPILPIFSALYNPKSYQQLLWDDIDNKLTTQKVCYSIPLVTEECTPLMSKTVLNDLSKFNQDERYYQKIVAYGGNNYTQSLYSKIMHAITSLAFLTSSGMKIWIQHNFLDLSTFLIERMPIIPPGYDRVTSNPERPFMANDGMVPLTSALFLRPGASEAITFNRNKLKYDNSFCQVAECHVVDGSIDHLGFLDDSSVLTFVLLKLKTLH